MESKPEGQNRGLQGNITKRGTGIWLVTEAAGDKTGALVGWQPLHPGSSQFTQHDPSQLTEVLVPSLAPCLERHWGLEHLDTSDKMRGSLG